MQLFLRAFRRRSGLIRIASLASALLIGLVASQAAQAAHKTAVCHVTGNGSYHLINVSTKALKAHAKHGDRRPGDIVPNSDDQLAFAEDCSLIPACPCAVDLPSGWASTTGISGIAIDPCDDGSFVESIFTSLFDDEGVALSTSLQGSCDAPTLYSCTAGGIERSISEVQYEVCRLTDSVP